MTNKNEISWSEVGTAQDASQTLLMIANSHPPSIGMGALIMATSVAAREMNIPLESIAAMLERTLTEVYAATSVPGDRKTMN